MSWGIKITILYAGFVALIIGMVILSMRQQVDLVSKDYYAQELAFQEKIDLINRTSELEQPLSWVLSKDSILLHFPPQFAGRLISGSILFFRPSDAKKDVTVEIAADTALLRRISTGKLQKGLYKMLVNWEAGDKRFYNEGVIQLQ